MGTFIILCFKQRVSIFEISLSARIMILDNIIFANNVIFANSVINNAICKDNVICEIPSNLLGKIALSARITLFAVPQIALFLLVMVFFLVNN